MLTQRITETPQTTPSTQHLKREQYKHYIDEATK
jgi:hypothetical protein